MQSLGCERLFVKVKLVHPLGCFGSIDLQGLLTVYNSIGGLQSFQGQLCKEAIPFTHFSRLRALAVTPSQRHWHQRVPWDHIRDLTHTHWESELAFQRVEYSAKSMIRGENIYQ